MTSPRRRKHQSSATLICPGRRRGTRRLMVVNLLAASPQWEDLSSGTPRGYGPSSQRVTVVMTSGHMMLFIQADHGRVTAESQKRSVCLAVITIITLSKSSVGREVFIVQTAG